MSAPMPPTPAALAALIADQLPHGAPVAVGDAAAAAALRGVGLTADRIRVQPTATAPLPDLAAGDVGAVVLLDGELSQAGDRAETLVAAAARVTRPGGAVAVAAPARICAELTGRAREGARRWSSDELAHLLGHRGLEVRLLAAPGAAARLAGRAWTGPADLPLDRSPGLLDAGEVLLAVAATPATEAQRSAHFFASLPRKVVAAGTICRDAANRLLVVHDSFRGHWTIPGGVVDAGEDPVSAAARETYEEAGVQVRVDALLGVFAADWPDRLLLHYAATPLSSPPTPRPRHPHEISAVRWAPADEALDLLAPTVAWRVRRCLDQPGGTWREPA